MDECKPDSVSRRSGKTTIHLSSRYPELLHPLAGTLRHGPRLIPYLALHREGFALQPAFSSGHGGLLHRLFTLTACAAVSFLWHCPFLGIAPRHPTFQSGSPPCGVRTFLPLRSGRPSPITPYNVIPKPPFAIRLGEKTVVCAVRKARQWFRVRQSTTLNCRAQNRNGHPKQAWRADTLSVFSHGKMSRPKWPYAAAFW